MKTCAYGNQKLEICSTNSQHQKVKGIFSLWDCWMMVSYWHRTGSDGTELCSKWSPPGGGTGVRGGSGVWHWVQQLCIHTATTPRGRQWHSHSPFNSSGHHTPLLSPVSCCSICTGLLRGWSAAGSWPQEWTDTDMERFVQPWILKFIQKTTAFLCSLHRT